MKRNHIFVLAFAILALPTISSAQGYTLVFNRVIDTIFSVATPSCTDLTNVGMNSNTVTVPAGRVWKIENAGPIEWIGNTTLYTSCTFSSSSTNNLIWGLYMDEGGNRAAIKRLAFAHTGSYVENEGKGPFWLRAGTMLYANAGPRLTTHRYVDNSGFSMKIAVSILEFRLVAITPP